MNFHMGTADLLNISDLEISELLSQVFVDGGFAAPDISTTLFEPSFVRSRGNIIGARSIENLIAGMVIVVSPDSPACHLAQANETEMHLLAVKPEYRGNGLGRVLVAAAIDDAKQRGYSKMLLWTQLTMQAAHGLYESSGFIRVPDRDFSRGGRGFWVYEKRLTH